MPLDSKSFKELFDALIKPIYDEYCEEYKDDIKLKFNNDDEFCKSIWLQYENLRDNVKSLHRVSHEFSVDNAKEDLIDPHKIASCLSLAILNEKPFQYKYRIKFNENENVPMHEISSSVESQLSSLGINEKVSFRLLLLNEVFAFDIGVEILRHVAFCDYKNGLSNWFPKFPIVDVYSNNDKSGYIDYMAYMLHRFTLTGKTSARNVVTYDVLHLSSIYHLLDCHFRQQ